MEQRHYPSMHSFLALVATTSSNLSAVVMPILAAMWRV